MEDKKDKALHHTILKNVVYSKVIEAQARLTLFSVPAAKVSI